MALPRVNSNTSSVALGFALLLVCGVSILWLSWQQRQAERWVRHTYEVERSLDQLELAQMRLEVDRRGYILTGKSDDAVRFSQGGHQLMPAIASLASLTADNSTQQARLSVLRAATVEWLASRARTIDLSYHGKSLVAAREVGSFSARNETNELHVIIRGLRSEEERLLAKRQARSERLQNTAQAIALGFFVLALLLASLVARDRKARMKSLRRSNEDLQNEINERERTRNELAVLAENATDAVLRLDLEGRCLYASPSVQEVLGRSPGSLVGKSMLVGFHADDQADVLAGYAQLGRGDIVRSIVTYRVIRPATASGFIWLEASNRLVLDRAGQPAEIITSLRDVTTRKQLEVELKRARERALDALNAKSTFLANMSHEIRTPMNGVIGFTEMLLTSELTIEQRAHAQLIADSGRAMMRLLNDILDLSKVEAGQMGLCNEPFDLPHALEACFKLITPAVAQKGVKLSCELSSELPKFVTGDGLRLRQIVLNLLGNAAKFTLEGRITLRARPSNEAKGVLIEIEDTGVGIEPDRQNAIFEQFAQASSGTASRFGGTGLGLAISLQLSRLMGGKLDVVSKVGHGSCFSLTLPLLPAPEAGAGPRNNETWQADASEAQQQLAGRILLVEDHDVNQLLFRTMLTKLGYCADLAENGAEAVNMVVDAARDGNSYSLVLMDMQMPVMGGLEASRQIRAAGLDARALPIIALTANAYSEDVAACRKAGMQAHLAKPVDFSKLQITLQRWTTAQRPMTDSRAPAHISIHLQDRYRMRRQEVLERLKRLEVVGNIEDHDASDVLDMLHKLAGTAAMFGEPALGDAARRLEEGLVSWRSIGRSECIRLAIDAIRQAA